MLQIQENALNEGKLPVCVWLLRTKRTVCPRNHVSITYTTGEDPIQRSGAEAKGETPLLTRERQIEGRPAWREDE